MEQFTTSSLTLLSVQRINWTVITFEALLPWLALLPWRSLRWGLGSHVIIPR